MPLLSELRSQARNAARFGALWSPGQLLAGAQVPVRRLFSRRGTAGRPLAVAQYLTYACPEKCSFCNVTHAVEDWQRALKPDDQARLVERLVPWVSTWAIGGGEPLAYKGLIDHIGRIRSRGGRVFVVTSAGTLDAEKARGLVQAQAITVSVLGDAATHDAVMGHEGAHERALAGVERVLSARDPGSTTVTLNCVVDLDNAHAMRAVAETGRRLGVDTVRFTWLSFLTPAERATEPHDVTVHEVSPERLAGFDAEGVLRESAALEREYGDLIQFQPQLSPTERARWFTPGGGVTRGCLSLWHTIFLRPDASMVPCGHLFSEPVGNALTDDPTEGWNAPRLRQTRLDQRRAPFVVCRRCCKV